MMHFVKDGLKMVWQHPALVIFLFLYQLAWGIFFYRFVQYIVTPLIYRFPAPELPGKFLQLFLAESQFQLAKTAISLPYLIIFGAMVLIRLLLTPLFTAGIFFSVHGANVPKTVQRSGGFWKNNLFFQGIREKGKTFFLLYWCQMFVMAAPLYWLWPIMKGVYLQAPALMAAFLRLAPILAGYFLFLLLVRLFFVYWMWGSVTGKTFLPACKVYVLRLPRILSIAVVILALSSAVSALTITASLIWAGFAALVVHQTYPLVRIVFHLWNLSAHYRFWLSETETEH